jgi:hypothetical protein
MEASEFENHTLWAKPGQMQELLEDLESAFENPSPDAFARLRWIATQLDKFRTVDPRFFAADQLRVADEPWQNVLNCLANYRGNPTGGYETQAVSYAEAWLQVAGSWHRPQTSSNVLAKQARDEYESVIASYKSVNENLAGLLEQERSSAQQQASSLQDKINSLETQVSTAQQALGELETTIKADKRVLEDAVTNHDEIFRSAQTDRTTTFTDWLKKQREDH